MTVCFLMRDKMDADPNGREGREEIGIVGGGKILIRPYCLTNVNFQ